MTRAEAFALTIQRCCDAAVEQQLEDAEIDLLDQGATAEHVDDELRCLRLLFEEHRDEQIAKAARWLKGHDVDTLH
jgi:hypothetical protein